MSRKFALPILTFWLLGLMESRAIIFLATDNVTNNTSAPAGALTNSGWQYEGQWQGFLGTPIAPTFFLAAKHVGGSIGGIFVLNGFTYHTVACTDSPDSDLRVWQVAETFPCYAPLFTAANEVGQHCVAFGRGTQRGDAVVVNGQTNGWLWGAADGVERWGENDVATIEHDPDLGDLLRCTFDREALTTNECHLSSGDSSGALFIQDGATWKLAGIHYGADVFSTDGTTATQFAAALLDMRGLLTGGGTNWTLIPTSSPTAAPSAFYATRVSAHLDWINSIINFQTGSDLRITALTCVGNDMQISLATGNSRLYRLDRLDDLATGSWTNVTNNLPGTGGIVTVTDPGAAALPQRFYRIQLNP